MKKMIFSAVALVAFSFAGMANEVDNNKNKKTTTKIEKEKTLYDCLRLAGEVYGKLKNILPDDEAVDNAMAYYQDCVDNL